MKNKFTILDIVNASILQDLPDTFHEATGVATGILDTNGELVTKIPDEDFAPFCNAMFHHPQGHRKCVFSNSCGAQRAFAEGQHFVYACHAGLIDVMVPIIFEGQHIGTVACGQILFEPPDDKKREEVRKNLAEFTVEFQEKQIEALDRVKVIPRVKVEAISKLLDAIAGEIVHLVAMNKRSGAELEEYQARTEIEKELMDAQLRLRETELRVLEAQINPHFLYNTLDSIQWLAVMEGHDHIRRMIQSLSQLMRFSLSRGNQVITVREELEQTRNYLYIQKNRYGDKLSFHINVEASILDYPIPKLIIQPIVENAIKHGLEPHPEKGTIWINGWQLEDGGAVLEVENDGVVMDDKTRRDVKTRLLEAISYDVDRQDSRQGYGLLNAHRRMQYTYGHQYGLSLPDSDNEVSCIRLTFPEVISGVNAV